MAHSSFSPVFVLGFFILSHIFPKNVVAGNLAPNAYYAAASGPLVTEGCDVDEYGPYCSIGDVLEILANKTEHHDTIIFFVILQATDRFDVGNVSVTLRGLYSLLFKSQDMVNASSSSSTGTGEISYWKRRPVLTCSPSPNLNEEQTPVILFGSQLRGIIELDGFILEAPFARPLFGMDEVFEKTSVKTGTLYFSDVDLIGKREAYKLIVDNVNASHWNIYREDSIHFSAIFDFDAPAPEAKERRLLDSPASWTKPKKVQFSSVRTASSSPLIRINAPGDTFEVTIGYGEFSTSMRAVEKVMGTSEIMPVCSVRAQSLTASVSHATFSGNGWNRGLFSFDGGVGAAIGSEKDSFVRVTMDEVILDDSFLLGYSATARPIEVACDSCQGDSWVVVHDSEFRNVVYGDEYAVSGGFVALELSDFGNAQISLISQNNLYENTRGFCSGGAISLGLSSSTNVSVNVSFLHDFFSDAVPGDRCMAGSGGFVSLDPSLPTGDMWLSVVDSTFTDGGSPGAGGALSLFSFIDESQQLEGLRLLADFQNVAFLSNYADHGGALSLGMHWKDSAVVSFNDGCRMESNHAIKSGGAISWLSGTTSIVSSSFVFDSTSEMGENRADEFGGAMEIEANDVSQFRLEGSVSNNEATVGGGLYFTLGTMNKDKLTTVSGNKATNGPNYIGMPHNLVFSSHQPVISCHDASSSSSSTCEFPQGTYFFTDAFAQQLTLPPIRNFAITTTATGGTPQQHWISDPTKVVLDDIQPPVAVGDSLKIDFRDESFVVHVGKAKGRPFPSWASAVVVLVSVGVVCVPVVVIMVGLIVCCLKKRKAGDRKRPGGYVPIESDLQPVINRKRKQ